jgi:D-3-phosphoglycerate dehydrogenase
MPGFKVALVAIHSPVPTWVHEGLAKEGVDFVFHECTTREELAQHAGDADLVWVHGGSEILTAENLAVIPRCGAIIRTGSGTDNVAVTEATERGIVVANTPEAHSDSVSDHAIALLLAVVRQIPAQHQAVRSGKWDAGIPKPRWHLRGKTLGLVGFGHIARLLVQKTRGFGVNIIAYDPLVSAEKMDSEGVRQTGLDDLLSEADFVSLHCPLLKETYHLIGERELRMMKPEAILINTSRGAVVDEPALIKALTERWIAGAGLDVLTEEPTPHDNPLLKLDNVVLTPHMAGHSDEQPEAGWRLSYDTVVALANGRWPRSYVNHDVKPRWRLSAE